LHDPNLPPMAPTIDSTEVPPDFGMWRKIGKSFPSTFPAIDLSKLLGSEYVAVGYPFTDPNHGNRLFKASEEELILLIVPAVAKTVAPAKATKPTVFFIDGNEEVADLFSEASFVVVAMSGCCSFAFIYSKCILYISLSVEWNDFWFFGRGRGKKRAIAKKEIPSFLLSSANATKKVSLSLSLRRRRRTLERQARARVRVSVRLRVLYISRECAFLFLCGGEWKKKKARDFFWCCRRVDKKD